MAKQIINEEFRRMQKLAGLLKEEFDFDLNLELDSFFKSNPVNEKNKYYVDDIAKKHIENKIGRLLTPQEKSKITRIANQYQTKYYNEKFKKQHKEEEDARQYRYQNNLLPLTTDNSIGTPDSKYYKPKGYQGINTYDGTTYTTYKDPKSGYTDYKLKDEWVDTPVSKDILDKYWRRRESN
jgi:hypothetical protein